MIAIADSFVHFAFGTAFIKFKLIPQAIASKYNAIDSICFLVGKHPSNHLFLFALNFCCNAFEITICKATSFQINFSKFFLILF